MSLISEALRKAQMDALQQDRDQRRYYLSHAGRGHGSSSSSARYVWTIAVLAVLCLVSAGALFYMSSRRMPVPSPAVARSPVVAAMAVPVKAAAVESNEEAKKSVADEAKPPVTRAKKRQANEAARPKESASVETAPAEEPQLVRERPVRGAAIAAAESRSAPKPLRRLTRDGFRDGEIYSSPVLGPFGTEVVLTGITSLGGRFAAIVNGSTVRAGATIGPFVIEEIEARRIRLRYVDISFYVVQ